MSDPVLTDDEKNALLDGVANGEVEVLSDGGPGYAAVKPFEISDRCRLESNSFPRLQGLNNRVGARLGKLTEQIVRAETEIRAAGLRSCPFGEVCEMYPGLSLTLEFIAKPLEGAGLVILSPELVAHFVEAFYGGSGNESIHRAGEFFTRGEIGVAALFCDRTLESLADVWRPVMQTDYERVDSHQSIDIIDGFDVGDRVICAAFEIEFLKHKQVFHVVWPHAMLAPLLPVFEGQKRDRDPAQDALWERALRARLIDSDVSIASHVGNNRMTLGNVAELAPGDVIDLDNPHLSTVFVKQVPVLNGRFGVHEGKYAVEAGTWLGADATA